jgi:uncharacterized protein YprB with RNaseH-like and TPR domain
LRFEVRLQNAKLKTLFKQLGIKRSLTLDGLFNATTARAVLMHYWREVTEGLYALEIDTRPVAKVGAVSGFPKAA